MTLIRSALFHVSFYAVTILMLVLAAPVFLLASERQAVRIVRLWGWIGVLLLRLCVGTRLEVRGRELMPAGAALVASKHQSMFETLALLALLPFPTAVMKKELATIPVFGRYTVATGMIHADREKGATALRDIARRAREELAKGRQIVMFPEGTRRPPGAPPQYQTGIGLLYKTLGVGVVPVALNSGLYWPRRGFMRYPGTIVIEFLPPMPPGLEVKAFLETLERSMEDASDRLLLEADQADRRPPFPAEAEAHLAALKAD